MNDLFIRGLRSNLDDIDSQSYLHKIEPLKNLKSLTFAHQVTFFTGENGSGKSTLLEAIAINYGFNPEGGTKNYSFSTFDSHSKLCDYLTLIKGARRPKIGYFLRAESFYNVATKDYEYGNEGKYHEKSHGESFLAVVHNYLAADGIYIFDEPEAALSVQRQLGLLLDIYEYSALGSQFIIATQSPILLGLPNAEIYSFDNGVIHQVFYEDTDSYKVTEMFINRRDDLLHKLLK